MKEDTGQAKQKVLVPVFGLKQHIPCIIRYEEKLVTKYVVQGIITINGIRRMMVTFREEPWMGTVPIGEEKA